MSPPCTTDSRSANKCTGRANIPSKPGLCCTARVSLTEVVGAGCDPSEQPASCGVILGKCTVDWQSQDEHNTDTSTDSFMYITIARIYFGYLYHARGVLRRLPTDFRQPPPGAKIWRRRQLSAPACYSHSREQARLGATPSACGEGRFKFSTESSSA